MNFIVCFWILASVQKGSCYVSQETRGETGTAISRESLQARPYDRDHIRREQSLSNPRMRTTYDVDWMLADAKNCAPHLLTVDLECRHGKIDAIYTSNAACIQLVGKDRLRCTSSSFSNATSPASSYAQVQCTCDSFLELGLSAMTVPFSVRCYEISNPKILLSINNPLCQDHVISYECANASPTSLDDTWKNGTCISTEPVLCYVVPDDYIGPYYVCAKFERFSVLALVKVSSIEEGTCWTQEAGGVEEESLTASPIPSVRPQPNSTASTVEQDTEQEATYQVYFDTVRGKTNTQNYCMYPAASVVLICGSGVRPTIHELASTTCYGVALLDNGPNQEPLITYRCTQVQLGIAGSVTASCAGRSEAARELFVYMEDQTLLQCSFQDSDNGGIYWLENRVWMSVVCSGELSWGGRRKCLQATRTNDAASDLCATAYECGNDDVCWGPEMVASASAGMDESCLAESVKVTAPSSVSSIRTSIFPKDAEKSTARMTAYFSLFLEFQFFTLLSSWWSMI